MLKKIFRKRHGVILLAMLFLVLGALLVDDYLVCSGVGEYVPPEKEQKEITEPSELLNEEGELIQRGWARQLILRYDREKVKGRVKEWDYYCILHPDYGLAVTVADFGYAGMVSIKWLDFKERTFYKGGEMPLFTCGAMNLPRTSEEGDIHYSGEKVTLSIERREGKLVRRNIALSFPGFRDGRGITARITLYQDPKDDTIVVAHPWSHKKTLFTLSQKINCMPAEGTVQIGEETFPFNRKSCFGVLDWGRTVRPYSAKWYWASASGKVDGVPIGWNLGGQPDLPVFTQNVIFYNGKAHKFDRVTYEIDRSNYLKPWKIYSNDGRFRMIFEPILDRSANMNYLIIKSIQHQCFGYYSGYVVLDDGRRIDIERMLGLAEEVYNRW